MLNKIITTITTILRIVIAFIVFIFATIYFMFRPEKAKEFNQEIRVEKTESNNTGLH